MHPAMGVLIVVVGVLARVCSRSAIAEGCLKLVITTAAESFAATAQPSRRLLAPPPSLRPLLLFPRLLYLLPCLLQLWLEMVE